MIVSVVEYHPEWPRQFQRESEKILGFLGNLALNLHHIGSTSVPGLKAKPIIDMLLEVSDLEALEKCSQDFEKMGYEVMGEFGIPGRRYFRKGGEHRTHHLHAFQSGDPNLTRHLAFRDYLIAHPDIADAYGTLKKEISQSGRHDMGTYSDQKAPFIQLHEPKAVEWYQKRML